MKQTLTVNNFVDLPSLHPHLLIHHFRGRVASKILFEGLTRLNQEGEAELTGATSVDISPDGKHYTFILRDMQWSDGTAVTAEHFAQAWKHALSPQSDCPRADLFYCILNAKAAKKGDLPLDAIGVQALDHKTLSIDLAQPCPHFLKLLAQPIFAPLINPAEEPKQFNGPFKVNNWEKGKCLELIANPTYWNYPQVKLDAIKMYAIADDATSMGMYEKKELDWMGNPFASLSSEAIVYLQSMDALHRRAVERMFYLYFNTDHPVLSCLPIRQALNLALNRSLITQHIFISGEPLSKPISMDVLPHTSLSLSADITEATQLFQQGLEELRLTSETLPPLTISYANEPSYKAFAQYLQETWSKAFGIRVKLEGSDWVCFRSKLEKGEFEIGGCVESMIDNDPLDILQRFEDTSSGCNFPRWVNVHYQEKIAQAKEESKLQKRTQLLMEAENILIKEVPFATICTWPNVYTHHPKLKGYIIDHTGCVDFTSAYFEN